MKRREIIKAGLSFLALSSNGLLASCGNYTSTYPSRGSLLTACDDNNGNHFIAQINGQGSLVFQNKVTQRVHAACYSNHYSKAVFIARRPGTELYVVDVNSGAIVQTIESRPGRHFYGHGAVSSDQSHLYLTENDFQNGTGIIGVYEMGESLRKVAEFPSYGIGPHQLHLLSDQKTVVVANGGMLTHPDSGRKVLNLSTMQSSLVYLDLENGSLIEKHMAPQPLMSMRHLAASKTDQVVIAVQYQGDINENVPLVATHQQGQDLHWLDYPESIRLKAKQYTASVAVNADNQHALVSCPRGNMLTLWDIKDGRFIDHCTLKDAAGLVALSDGRWMATTGYGELAALQQSNNSLILEPISRLSLRWDNHATLI